MQVTPLFYCVLCFYNIIQYKYQQTIFWGLFEKLRPQTAVYNIYCNFSLSYMAVRRRKSRSRMSLNQKSKRILTRTSLLWLLLLLLPLLLPRINFRLIKLLASLPFHTADLLLCSLLFVCFFHNACNLIRHLVNYHEWRSTYGVVMKLARACKYSRLTLIHLVYSAG